jgi:oligopeptidase A
MELINFDIKLDSLASDLNALLEHNRQAIAARLAKGLPYTWDNFITPLEEQNQVLAKFWSPIGHLHAVKDTPVLREAYNQCLPLLSAYSTELGQNVELYSAYQSMQDSEIYESLNEAQKKVIDNALRDFKLSGVALVGEARERYQAIQLELSQLETKFEENVLDATSAFSHHILDEALLHGLPTHTISQAKKQAEDKSLAGWLLGLDQPTYLAVMQYADNRNLREIFYRAYQTRASTTSSQRKLGSSPTLKKLDPSFRWDDKKEPKIRDQKHNFDNTPIMNKIVALRQEKATLLGFKNYADYSLERKMANSQQHVFDLLGQLANAARPFANQEIAELKNFALNSGVNELQSWDIAYYSEKLRHQKFNIDDESLRVYFPEPVVLSGMFEILNRLYGMMVTEIKNCKAWHPDVKLFKITDEKSAVRGYFYTDLYARAGKRNGAWMDGYCDRFKTENNLQDPIAYLTCNFTPPSEGQPALFKHDDVVTLFHETGHCLQHLLTQIDYPDVAGINGVPWDAVELPSQFFENWCWSTETLPLISQHYQTGEAFPTPILNQLLAAKNFQAGLQTLRQVEFALFDMRVHTEYNSNNPEQIAKILSEVRTQISVFIPPEWTQFQNSFTHVFSGGYAAGYYSYKWAEVLSADAFDRFIKEGVFNQTTGRAFLKTILESGGSREAMNLFIAFRGREPHVEALLKQEGLA